MWQLRRALASSPIVSNTTPFISLVGVGLLDLLPQVYGEIWIPEQVHAEYQAGASPRDPDLATQPWIHMVPVAIGPPLLDQLNPGEAAAIMLAITVRARAVLLDEQDGRRVARERGLVVVGSLGVLVRAKALGILPAIKPSVDEMIAQGRYISPVLRAQVLQAAGEEP
jgi:predicted nucleic acid-binding protein